MELLDYKVGDKVEVLITDVLNENKWVDGEVVEVKTTVLESSYETTKYPCVVVKYMRNYSKWRGMVVQFYQSESTSNFYYRSDIRLK